MAFLLNVNDNLRGRGLTQLLLGAAEHNGAVSIRGKRDGLFDLEPAGTAGIELQLLQGGFYHLPLVTHRLDRDVTFFAGLQQQLVQDRQFVELRLNLAELLCLQGEDPAQELTQVAQAFKDVKHWMSDHPSQQALLTFTNEKDVASALTGRATLIELKQEQGHLQRRSQDLTTTFNEYPGAAALMRAIAVSLGEYGLPGATSTLSVTEDALFGVGNGPHYLYLQELSAERTVSRYAKHPSI